MVFSRPSWDEYFMKIAEEVATRATCPRKRLGAVIVKDKRIIATGYNGSPPGIAHCDEAGCKLAPTLYVIDGKHKVVDHCVRTLHAEQNAIIQAAKHGVRIDGATLYTTLHPCSMCAKMAINAGVRRIVCREDYPDDLGKTLLSQGGVTLDVFRPAEAKSGPVPGA